MTPLPRASSTRKCASMFALDCERNGTRARVHFGHVRSYLGLSSKIGVPLSIYGSQTSGSATADNLLFIFHPDSPAGRKLALDETIQCKQALGSVQHPEHPFET
jgi:hypothetical protein